jgi:AraC-like DNA-binding protein
MRYQEFMPGGSLRDHVQCFWMLEASAHPQPEVERILPDGCPELIFHFADRFCQLDDDGCVVTQPRTFLVGQMRRHLFIQPTGRVGILGLRFHPAGAAAFFPMPQREFTGQVVPLDLLWGRRSLDLEAQIAEVPSLQARLRVLVRALVEKFATASCPDLVVRATVEVIQAAGGMVSISRVAQQAGLSPRQLQRRFGQQVGLAPKEFSRLVRFQRLVRAARASSRPDWPTLALDCGYADQAHCIRDFKDFVGETPAAFLATPHAMSDAFTPPAPAA